MLACEPVAYCVRPGMLSAAFPYTRQELWSFLRAVFPPLWSLCGGKKQYLTSERQELHGIHGIQNIASNHMMLVNRSLTTSLLSLALHIHCYCVMHDSSVVDTMLSILLCDAFTLGPSVWFAERHIRSLSHQCLCVQRMALRVACSSMRAA